MKKILTIFLLISLLSLFWISMAAAEAGDADIDGEIIAVDDVGLTITVKTLDDQEFLVSFPPDFVFNFTTDDVGTYVHVIGEFIDDTSILAESVDELAPADIEGKIIGVSEDGCTITVKTVEWDVFEVHVSECGYTPDDIGTWVHVKGVVLGDGSILAESIEVIEPPEVGGKEESAYCSGEKEKQHPVATKIAAVFDTTYEEVMGYFCDGFGFGQIILAYQTSLISGENVADILAKREAGMGWGQIWKELGFKGKPKEDKEDKVSPGQKKKMDEPKEKEHPVKPDKDKDKGNDKVKKEK
jgi:hypothetical protein